MVDVFLIQPPIEDFYLTRKRTLPYGLACIAAALRTAGFSVALFDALATSKSRPLAFPEDMTFLAPYYGRADTSPFALFHQYRHFGYSYDHIGRQAAASGAPVVGIASLFTAYSDCALQTVDAIRRQHPDCTIVMGGHHPTALPEDVLVHPGVDYVIRGEGETALPELVKALKEGRPVDAVPGIACRMPDGRLKIKDPALMPSLDAYPAPAADLIPHAYYRRKTGTSAVVVTSRGCPMSCAFCAVAGWPHRRRSLENIMAEIKTAVHDLGARFIDFEDENISLDRQWFNSFLDHMITAFPDVDLELRAMNGLYAPTLTPEILEKMKTAGFRELNLSLGANDRRQLRRFHRPDIRGPFARIAGHARAAGLSVVGYIIVGAPGQSASASVADILALAAMDVLVGVSPYYPAPGSRDFDQLKTGGCLPPKTALMRGSTLPVCGAGDRTDTATLLRLGRIANFMKYVRDRNAAMDTDAGSGRDLRFQDGLRLLRSFLETGVIHGRAPDGAIYAHTVSQPLVDQFREGLAAGGISIPTDLNNAM